MYTTTNVGYYIWRYNFNLNIHDSWSIYNVG